VLFLTISIQPLTRTNLPRPSYALRLIHNMLRLLKKEKSYRNHVPMPCSRRVSNEPGERGLVAFTFSLTSVSKSKV